MLPRVQRICEFPVPASRFTRVIGRFAPCSLDGARSRRPAYRTGALQILITGLGLQVDFLVSDPEIRRAILDPGAQVAQCQEIFSHLATQTASLQQTWPSQKQSVTFATAGKLASPGNIIISVNAACNGRPAKTCDQKGTLQHYI